MALSLFSVHGKTLLVHLFLKYVGVLNMQVCFSGALSIMTMLLGQAAAGRCCWQELGSSLQRGEVGSPGLLSS